MSCLKPFLASAALILSVASATFASEAHTVFKSVDNGTSWVAYDTGIPKTTRTNAFGKLGKMLFAGTDSGLFFTERSSQSWKAIVGLPTKLSRIISIATAGANVFVGTDGNGMFVSTDKGESWTRNTSLQVKKVRALLFEHGTLYAGTDTDGVFVSDDYGISWHNLMGGLPADAQVFDLAMVKGKLFTALYAKGLYAWQDGGNCWTKSGNVRPLVLASSRDTLIAGHNPGGLYWSDNAGVSWRKGTGSSVDGVSPLRDLLCDAPVWEAGANDKLAFAGAADGIYLSTDHGRTWMRSRTGLPSNGPGIAFLVTPDLVLAATTIVQSE
ncbi:MAG: exo-alpha-sialidase [Planctomycetales bacterium]|nr:exo-alpha-sialidase [Planctomycetales bacterium]